MENSLQSKIAALEVHLLYIRERVDSLATKRELNLHRYLIGGLFLAVLSLGIKIIGVL